MSTNPIRIPDGTAALAIVDADVVDPDEDFTREQAEAAAMAEGLRQLARLIDANPNLVEVLRYPLGYMGAPIGSVAEPRRVLAAFSRATLAVGGTVDKHYTGDAYAGINANFGPVCVQVFAERAQVCERVVVGTTEVTRQVPDPDALAAVPTVPVTETVETVEWRCTSLLKDVPLLADGGPS